LAPVSNDEEAKKLDPITVPKIIEQLERALIDIKYNKSYDDELVFNKIENVPINSKNHERPHFIGRAIVNVHPLVSLFFAVNSPPCDSIIPLHKYKLNFSSLM